MAALAMALLTAPLAANAALGEFAWSGREGSGRLVWDLDAVDSDPGATSASFLNGIVSFDFTGSLYGQLGSGIHLQGTGGSYSSSWVHHDISYCQIEGIPCDTATLKFDLGAARPGDPAQYTLTFSTQFALDDGRLPIPLPERGQDYGWLNAGLTNNLDDRFYIVFDTRSRGETRELATPVPEPGLWVLFGLGAALVGGARRTRGRGTGASAAPALAAG